LISVASKIGIQKLRKQTCFEKQKKSIKKILKQWAINSGWEIAGEGLLFSAGRAPRSMAVVEGLVIISPILLNIPAGHLSLSASLPTK